MKTILLIISFAAPGMGMELVRRDLWLGFEALPTDFDFTLTTPSGDVTGSDSFDRTVGVRLGGRWSFSSPGAAGAWVAGADLRFADAIYANDGTYRTTGVGLSFGYDYALGRRWTAYGEPVVELGWAKLDFPSSTAAPAVSADGRHILYGVRGGVLFALSPRWLLDGSVGYVAIESDTEADDNSYLIEQRGFVLGLGIVWRLSGAPARLE